MGILDAYYKKTITYEYQGKTLKFKVSQALFSSHIIDSGTQRLLRTFMNTNHFNKILDLGCGYGPIGITLKTLNPNSEVHMIDRDALALEYTQVNADLNKITNYKIYGSLGYDNVSAKDFDLIISNIPAKVGKNVLSHLLIDSQYFLVKNGLVAIVVVDAILDDVNQILTDPNIEIVLKKSWNGHTVFHYRFITSANLKNNRKINGFEAGLYDRTQNKLNVLDKIAILKTTYNLSEFDEMSYETQMLIDNLTNIKDVNIQNCVIYNINQGHIPVAISAISDVQKMILVDRNLQSLSTTSRNLKLNGFPEEKIITRHQVDLDVDDHNLDCFVVIIDKKEGREANHFLIKQVLDQLSKNGRAYLESTSNIITQLEKLVKKDKRISVLKRTKYRGETFLMFEKISI